MTSGIYCIENLVNGKKYIGLSINIEDRWYVHKTTLRGNYHDNSYLQNAWNKYGENNFEFWIIEKCGKNETILKKKEMHYIRFYNSFAHDKNGGYNLSRGGDRNFGYKLTPEQLKHHIEVRIGKITPQFVKDKISKALLGKPKPEGYGQRKQGVKKKQKFKTTSKYVGVSYDSERDKWRFELTVKEKRIRGRRNTEKEAALAYNEAAIKAYGKNAKLNIIEED